MKNNKDKKVENKNIKARKIGAICVVAMIFLLCAFSFLSTTETFSKYISNFQANFFTRTSNFYFESSILKESTSSEDGGEEVGASYEVTAFVPSLATELLYTQPTGSYIAFTVYNYENQFNITDEDVPYSLAITINDVALDINLYQNATTLTGGEQSLHQYYLSVADSCFENDDSKAIVTIKVESTSPYVKTLSGEFTLSESTLVNVDASVTSGTYNEEVAITSGNVGGYLYITVPSDLVLDTTSNITWELTSTDTDATVYKITVSAYAEYKMNFFKQTTDGSVEYDVVVVDATQENSETNIYFTWENSDGTTGTTQPSVE